MPMILDQWAKKWNIPAPALLELRQSFGIISAEALPRGRHTPESAIQNLVRIEASERGCRLWRNNLGAATTQDGSFIRYGLANDSSAINKQIKSADLIGIRPVIITQGMVGYTIGQFLSREIKTPGWKYRGNEREAAQLRWAELIVSLGGDATFTSGTGSI